MAQLYFYYAAMNAGKSTSLLQSAHNYRERGLRTLLLAPGIDNRFGPGKIASRIGLEAAAIVFSPSDDLLAITRREHTVSKVDCVLVDEAQFLSAAQVDELCEVTDREGIPVLAFGLRTDFRGELFPGSARLLAVADNLSEIKTICHCGRKATMVL
ncbi:MAG: thymidine kinase, partial [Verrucomicrobiae bacterium]|nr:thymidine kinase [Verrucomicrobiae bacterium]